MRISDWSSDVCSSDLGKRPGRYGNGHPNIVPYTTYAAEDGTIAVAVGNDKQFEKFAALLGKPEWAGDEAYRTKAARIGNRVALDGLIGEIIAKAPAGLWIARLMAQGIPDGRIQKAEEAL